jgi:hypothetical protein
MFPVMSDGIEISLNEKAAGFSARGFVSGCLMKARRRLAQAAQS